MQSTFSEQRYNQENKSLSSKSNKDFESLPPLQMFQMPLKWLQCLMTSASNCTVMSFEIHQTHTSLCHTWISPMESWFIQAVFCWLNMQFKKLMNIISILNHQVCFNLSSSLTHTLTEGQCLLEYSRYQSQVLVEIDTFGIISISPRCQWVNATSCKVLQYSCHWHNCVSMVNITCTSYITI